MFFCFKVKSLKLSLGASTTIARDDIVKKAADNADNAPIQSYNFTEKKPNLPASTILLTLHCFVLCCDQYFASFTEMYNKGKIH